MTKNPKKESKSRRHEQKMFTTKYIKEDWFQSHNLKNNTITNTSIRRYTTNANRS